MGASKIKIVRLAHVHYQHPDLHRGISFLKDFGLVEESTNNKCVFLRGYGIQPFLYIAEPSPDTKRHFLGGYWVVESEAELEKASWLPGASPIQDLEGPGGGKVVRVADPNGNTVGFVHGQNLRTANNEDGSLERNDSGVQPNTASQKARRGAWRRFDVGPSPINKLGHYGYLMPADQFQSTLDWYLSTINLKITDCIYDPKTGKDETCFMHIDLGQTHTDHHSLFLGISPEAPAAFVHHSSFEVNDFDTQILGHDYLREKGWTNCWGVGRHVLGSQIFDYWFDGSGNVVEHYSDGDLVNEDTPVSREAAAPESLYVWGPNLPLGFATGKIEDAGTPLYAPPDVLAATPAQV